MTAKLDKLVWLIMLCTWLCRLSHLAAVISTPLYTHRMDRSYPSSHLLILETNSDPEFGITTLKLPEATA